MISLSVGKWEKKIRMIKEGFFFFFQFLKILRIIPNIITKNMIWNPIA